MSLTDQATPSHSIKNERRGAASHLFQTEQGRTTSSLELSG